MAAVDLGLFIRVCVLNPNLTTFNSDYFSRTESPNGGGGGTEGFFSDIRIFSVSDRKRKTCPPPHLRAVKTMFLILEFAVSIK